MRLPSGSHPTAPHLEEDRDHVATDGDVEAGVYSVALRQLVTNATPAGDHPVKGVEALEVVPGAAAPAERDQAEALPELPAQLSVPRSGVKMLSRVSSVRTALNPPTREGLSRSGTPGVSAGASKVTSAAANR